MSTDGEHTKELLDRVRRIETRLTRFLAAQGAEMTTEKPEWQPGIGVLIPSLDCSLRSILSAVPGGEDTNYQVLLVSLKPGKLVLQMMVASEFRTRASVP